VILHAWSDHRNITRRVIAVRSQKPGRLELGVRRFGRETGTLLLVDLDRPEARHSLRRGERWVCREHFHRFLTRCYPDWKVTGLSSEQDLEHTLSPIYPRALLKKAGVGWAAIGAPAEEGASNGVLTFGLVWLDYLRKRERRLVVEGLILWLPHGQEMTTCLRLMCLNPRAVKWQVFVYDDSGVEQPVDPADHGNLRASLRPCLQPTAPPEWLNDIARLPDVDAITAPDGALSLRVRGLEFASYDGEGVVAGLDRKEPAGEGLRGEIESLARNLVEMRSPVTPDRANPLWSRGAELWLESKVRRELEVIDATLERRFLYGQAPMVAGLDRGVLDLLAVDRTGRLAVIELKAAADPHLPVQALDYWMRAAWHAERGDFVRLGYFPGIALRGVAPRLLLVAPALEFHPTTETILRYFSAAIEVTRIGVGVEWRKDLRVMFRIRGARTAV